MCIGGSPSYATPQRETAAFQDAPPVVTGKQTGVENPKEIAFNDFMFITPSNDDVQDAYRQATSGLEIVSSGKIQT